LELSRLLTSPTRRSSDLMLRAQSVRVIPALPGRSTVGIEIPSEQRNIIRFGDVIKSPRFRGDELTLPVALGVDTFGNPVVEDLIDRKSTRLNSSHVSISY